ncbi:sensor histidine kinase [Nonomuraea sp. NPDC050783]|uniref:sensor histidine kinase n=1 Tax=Nonomuraea sp. NPDC050783 TaxID=3154634 RepID=UPI003466B131
MIFRQMAAMDAMDQTGAVTSEQSTVEKVQSALLRDAGEAVQSGGVVRENRRKDGTSVRRTLRGVVRDTAYLLCMLFTSLTSVLLLFLLAVAVGSTVVAGMGLVLAPLAVQVVRRWTDVHRALAGWVLGEQVPRRYRPLRGGIGSWMRQVVADRMTWRDLGWLAANAVVGLVAGAIGLFFAGTPPVTLFTMFFWWLAPVDDPLHMLMGTPVTSWSAALATGLGTLAVSVPSGVLVVPRAARLHAAMTRALIGRSTADELERRVEALTEARTGVIDAHGAELRRIERDLHDGTQARLVSIAMRLGMAKQALGDDPEVAARLIDDARIGAESAMGELRSILRTMYPPVLTDRGLGGAIHALAAQSGVPVQVDVEDLGLVSAPAEAATYFTIAEALTNAAKHSGASVARVTVHRTGDWLSTTVEDDGCGGVDETRGSGVVGIRRRIEALEGAVHIDSPHGGPTTIKVELPCGS